MRREFKTCGTARREQLYTEFVQLWKCFDLIYRKVEEPLVNSSRTSLPRIQMIPVRKSGVFLRLLIKPKIYVYKFIDL